MTTRWNHDHDPLEPVKGILLGVIIGALGWALIIIAAYLTWAWWT